MVIIDWLQLMLTYWLKMHSRYHWWLIVVELQDQMRLRDVVLVRHFGKWRGTAWHTARHSANT